MTYLFIGYVVPSRESPLSSDLCCGTKSAVYRRWPTPKYDVASGVQNPFGQGQGERQIAGLVSGCVTAEMQQCVPDIHTRGDAVTVSIPRPITWLTVWWATGWGYLCCSQVVCSPSMSGPSSTLPPMIICKGCSERMSIYFSAGAHQSWVRVR